MFSNAHLLASPGVAGIVGLLLVTSQPAFAQQPTQARRDSIARADSIKKAMAGMPGMAMPGGDSSHAAHGSRSQADTMMMIDPLGVPMDRMGSGTTWIPDAVALPARHFIARKWKLMLHGFAFVQENAQGGQRGQSQFGSLNWGMFMASHDLAGGRFQARTMLSFDPATVTNRGYPLLLQTGETYRGEALHDRQHPHDFLMELGAAYERPIGSRFGFSLYAAPSGEPALGPVAFMHRPSAMDIPTVPIGHHWQDATHISFGVVTAGVFTNRWKLEGSAFNGREPDEERWGIDPIRLNSYSGRLTLNPSASWSLTAGYGYLESPEALHPRESMHRLSASALHGMKLGTEGQWSTTVVWGANKEAGNDLTHSVLFESEAVLDRTNTVFARGEWVQKSADDLVLDAARANDSPPQLFNVSAFSLGYVREIGGWNGATIGLGAMGTLNVVPTSLEKSYGSRTPVGGLVFLRLRPSFARSKSELGGMRMSAAQVAIPKPFASGG